MDEKRNYNYSDVNMCLAAETVVGSFTFNITELSGVRTNWTAEYAADFEGRIDDAIDNYLGTDAFKGLRDATGVLKSLMVPAKRDLSFVKSQIDEDFKDNSKKRKEIIKNLGFNKNLKAVQNGDQEALIELLFAIKKNMTDKLKLEITAKGMNPVLIDNIIQYANQIKKADSKQEGLKGSPKEISHEVIQVFNSIYNEVIGICKFAADFYQYDPIKKEQFTFSKVVANMNAPKKSKNKPEENE
jgi:hypothetical protein